MAPACMSTWSVMDNKTVLMAVMKTGTVVSALVIYTNKHDTAIIQKNPMSVIVIYVSYTGWRITVIVLNMVLEGLLI